jgi:acyl carrier protein
VLDNGKSVWVQSRERPERVAAGVIPSGKTDPPPAETSLLVLARLLGRICEQDGLIISPATFLDDIPGVDSLRILQAVALMEDHFQVEIDVITLNDCLRVRDILGAIAKARPMAARK